MILNGKRPWKPEIRERYEQLVNTSVNTLAKTEEKMDNRQADLLWRIRLEAEDTALSRRKSSSQAHYPSSTTFNTGTIQSLNEYVIYLRNRGLNEDYISKLSEYLRKFCDWAGNTVVTLSAESAEKYLSQSAHLKPNSRARYLAYLKSYLSYLGIPFEMKVKVPKTLPPYVETSDIHRIVEWIKNRKTYRNTIDADLTLVMMAMKIGIRRGELGNLKVKDVNLDKRRIYVPGGKGDKDRVIPIHPDLVDGLSRLIEGKAGEAGVYLSQAAQYYQ